MAKKSGKRFKLLLYERMWHRWAFPCLIIAPGSIAIWLFADRIPFIHTPWAPLAIIPALASLIIFIYTYLARHLSWVQCRPKHLRVRTPILPLAVSYLRIKGVKPARLAQVFDPNKEKAGRRAWLNPYWGKTALVVELSGYPVNEAWLRLWFSPYMLSPDGTGLVLLVDDWMALSRQIEEYKNDRLLRHSATHQ